MIRPPLPPTPLLTRPADDALDSGLSLGDLYRWQRDYAERCRAIEYQLGELSTSRWQAAAG